MNAPFTPATTAPLPLIEHDGVPFEVVLSNKSAFRGFEIFTTLPVLHLTVSAAKVPGQEMPTWATWDPTGAKIAVVQGAVRGNFNNIVRHFFGDALSVEDATWGDSIRGRKAARRPHPHFQLYIGHKDLWPGENEEGAFITRGVDSLLAPRWIVQSVVDHLYLKMDDDDVAACFEGDESARERVLAMLMSTLKLDRPDPIKK